MPERIKPLMPRYGEFRRPISTGFFIRNYLEGRPATPFEVFRAYKQELKRLGEENKKDYYIPSYHSFWKYFWYALRLNLIKKTSERRKAKYPQSYPKIKINKEEKGVREPQFYTLIDPSEKIWKNLQKALYPWLY